MEMNPLPEEEVNMTTQPLCECGHEAQHHAIDRKDWKRPVCLTQFWREPLVDPSTGRTCRCEEYRAA